MTEMGWCPWNPELPEECLGFCYSVVIIDVWSVDMGCVSASPFEDISFVLNGPQSTFLPSYVEPLAVGGDQNWSKFPQMGFISFKIRPTDVLHSVNV